MVTLVMVELRSYAPVFLGQRGDRSSFSMLGLTLYGSRFLWDFRGTAPMGIWARDVT